MSSHDRYERRRGSKPAKGPRKRIISFSFSKLDRTQGQSWDEWEKDGLLADLCKMMVEIGQHEVSQVLAQQKIKQYTKVGYPPNSKFKEPNHVSPTYWAVIHLKPNSKEVVAGFLEEDVFYIVFLDKEHEFWPTDIQARGKKRV